MEGAPEPEWTCAHGRSKHRPSAASSVRALDLRCCAAAQSQQKNACRIKGMRLCSTALPGVLWVIFPTRVRAMQPASTGRIKLRAALSKTFIATMTRHSRTSRGGRRRAGDAGDRIAGVFRGVVEGLLALSHHCGTRLCTGRLAHPGPWGEAWRAWRRTRVGSPGPPFFVFRSGIPVEDGTAPSRARCSAGSARSGQVPDSETCGGLPGLSGRR